MFLWIDLQPFLLEASRMSVLGCGFARVWLEVVKNQWGSFLEET